MAIDFACECGRKLHVPDKMAGKKGKCPECGKILLIPSESDPALVAAPEPEPEPEEPAEETQPCPHCGEAIAVGAVFCTQCGTDLRTGEKQEADEEITVGYNPFKIWPDAITRPNDVVSTVLENPLSAQNFQRVLILYGVGAIGFVLLWVLYVGRAHFTGTEWYQYVALALLAFVIVVVDAVIASMSGNFLGSSGTTMAQTVMSLLLLDSVYGLMHLLLVPVVFFTENQQIAMWAPWVLLCWSGYLLAVVIHRGYDAGQGMSIAFGMGGGAVKGLLIYTTVWLLGGT